MAETDKVGVVDLVDAGVPADQGLAALGMIMQLAGHVLAAAALFGFVIVGLGAAGGSGVMSLLLFAIIALCAARSIAQVSAGKRLLFGEPGETGGGRLAGVHRYIRVALVQSAIVTALVALALGAGAQALGVGLGLAVWPVTLAVLLRLPRFRRFGGELPVAEDKGFEGAAVLMTVFGLSGSVATAFVLWMLLHMSGSELQRGPNVLVLLAIAMLLLRSLFHVRAGVSGLRSTSLDRSVDLANRYANFGVISSFCAAGALLVFAMASGMQLVGIALVCGLCWILAAWPLIVRSFFADRQFSDLLAGGAAPLHRRAPDAGLTSLGWFLLAYAAWNAAFALPSVFASERSMDLMRAFGGSLGVSSLWWNVVLVMMQGWAGFELIRMSRHSKAVTTAYALLSVAITVYLQWPMLRYFASGHLASAALGANSDTAFALGPIAFSLILPITALILVHRTIAPAAQARFHDRTP